MPKIIEWDKEKMSVNGLYTDFRSDVIAAALVDNGFDANKILIFRRRSTSRQTDKEIASIKYYRNHDSGEEGIEIYTTHSGMYDNLPECLFHLGLELKSYNKETVVHALRQEEKTEISARTLFSVYEAETERMRIKIRLLELYYDRPFKHRTLADTVGLFWPVLTDMDSLSVILFTHAIPHIEHIRNRNGYIAHTIATILGLPVAIKPGRCTSGKIASARLGAVKLGINAVLKGYTFETAVDVEVTVGEDTTASMLPGEKLRHIMERLLKILLPEETEYRIVLCPCPEGYTFRIGDPEKPFRLGVNARLKLKDTEERTI